MSHSFNNIEKQLGKIQSKIQEEFEGYVSFEELFDLGFIDRNSDFGTIGELFNSHGIIINSLDDFESVCEDILDNAVLTSTKFATWKDMYKAAGQEYAIKKLENAGFDIS